MHYVFVLVYQQRTVCNRHNIRNLIRRCTDNGLQAHPSQETDALNNAITIHFVKCLIKHCQSDGVAETGCIVHTVELSEGSQNRNIKRSLCFTAGLCVQGLRKQLLCSVLIRGFQVKLQVCPKIGISLDIFQILFSRLLGSFKHLIAFSISTTSWSKCPLVSAPAALL